MTDPTLAELTARDLQELIIALYDAPFSISALSVQHQKRGIATLKLDLPNPTIKRLFAIGRHLKETRVFG